jgi:vinculin
MLKLVFCMFRLDNSSKEEMPVFHTKTIESILEPVAQQISKLVILHEETDDGNDMPDLSLAVQIVKQAADNLIKVGYETTENSDDLTLKHQIPAALNRVEEACYSLQEAAIMLKIEPKSPIGKRNLIAGERGILQGVSAILLTFDESEVRKIIKICNQVLEYLSITELIEKMDDLVTYVKNLTPILTKMTREIDQREKELTHQIHRDLLMQHLEQVKNLTPVFISSIKINLIILDLIDQHLNDNHLNQLKLCIEQSKEFLIRRLSEEINEMVRILQLTTYDEDEWMSDDLTLMKQKLVCFCIISFCFIKLHRII